MSLIRRILPALCAPFLSSVADAAPQPPNILLIFTDDHGYGDVSTYGASDIRTPNIDRIAAEGMLFTTMRANSTVCSPTRAALLTGKNADRAGVPGVIRTHAKESWGYLDPASPTLADLLNAAGYDTALIGKWHLGLETPNTPNERGFGFFHGFLGDMMDSYTTHRRHGNNYMRRNTEVIEPEGHATELFSDWTADWLRNRAAAEETRPFFVLLSYNAPHFPIQPPDDWLARVKQRAPDMDEDRAKNVAFVEHLDDGIGRVLAALEETGQAGNTLVVFTADNGGSLRHAQNNDPWRGGKQDHYDGGLRVPFMARWPGRIEPGSQSDHAGLVFDLFPTFLELAGAPPAADIDAVSLVPVLDGGEDTRPRDLYFVRREGGFLYGGNSYEAIIRGDWKLLRNDPYSPLELYNLKDDPGETTNLIDAKPETFRELATALRGHIQRGGATPWQPPARTHPHVLIILVDDMGYGDAGCYNPESKIPTPHIDRLAAEGMRFTDAHAPGTLCHPSRYGLLTGRFPFRTDITRWPTQPLIDEGQMTIASLLKDAGHATAMVGKWHLGFAENGYENPLPGGPVDRGFQDYFGIRASTDIPPYFYIRGDRAVTPPTGHIAANNSEGWTHHQGAFWREGGIAPDLNLAEVLPRFTDEAIDVIRTRDADKPLMLYLAYPAPHTPWLPTPEFEGKSGAGMYGDFMMMVDHEIGRVLAALDAAGMAGETLVVFTSDNGPVWYAEDIARFSHDASGGLRGIKGDAWEGGHRMPFIVRWPRIVGAGTVSDATICFTDLLATLAEITGRRVPSDAGPDSVSFLPALMGRVHQRPPIVIQSGNGMMTIRDGRWKLIDGLGSGGFSRPGRITPGPGDPSGQLYDLKADPAETTNLYLEHPQVVEELRARMRDIVEGG